MSDGDVNAGLGTERIVPRAALGTGRARSAGHALGVPPSTRLFAAPYVPEGDDWLSQGFRQLKLAKLCTDVRGAAA